MWLINPNGIAITQGAVIDTGAFLASSLDIRDQDFLAGNYVFWGDGQSAAVTHLGAIQVREGGYAARWSTKG